MKNNTKIKLAGVLLGAALSSTGAYAGSGSCGAGKCGGKKMMDSVSDEMKGNMGKKSEMKCAAGKCGANMMKDMEKEKNENYQKGHMKKEEMMEKKANKKVEGSCGAGKCG